jgi:ATP-binding protein involved in chromosome partitioning
MPATILSTESVLAVLQPVQDPELQKSLVDLNMIRNVAIDDGGNVRFTLVLTTPACPLRELIVQDCTKAVKTLPGVGTVDITVTAETPQQKNNLPDRTGVPGVKNVIAVSSGKGGVGKSTVAVNIAVALAQAGSKVGLIDADIYGPNAPMMLGLEGAKVQVGAQGERLEPAFNHGVKLVSMGFLIDKDQPVIWRGPMLNGVIRQFLYQVNWGELDYLIVDMPPGTGDAQLTLAQAVPMAGVVIVSTPQNVALSDARRGLKMFQQLGIHVLGIVENMSYFIPPDMPDRRYDIFGSKGGEKTATELGLPLLGCVPLEMSVGVSGDQGLPIVLADSTSASAKALVAIAQQVAAKVSIAALG